jgi:hypothetical protein
LGDNAQILFLSVRGPKKEKKKKEIQTEKKKPSGRHPSRPISGPMKNELRANISLLHSLFFLLLSFLVCVHPAIDLHIYIILDTVGYIPTWFCGCSCQMDLAFISIDTDVQNTAPNPVQVVRYERKTKNIFTTNCYQSRRLYVYLTGRELQLIHIKIFLSNMFLSDT